MNRRLTEPVNVVHTPSPTALLLCFTSCAGVRAPACTAVTAPAPPGLRERLIRVTLGGMDTTTTPRVSPVLEPETMTALMLRYCEVHEEAAYQYARQLVRRLTADLCVHDAVRLARDIVTETTNDIGDFEGEVMADRVDVALRRLIDRVEADQAFLVELDRRNG